MMIEAMLSDPWAAGAAVVALMLVGVAIALALVAANGRDDEGEDNRAHALDRLDSIRAELDRQTDQSTPWHLQQRRRVQAGSAPPMDPPAERINVDAWSQP